MSPSPDRKPKSLIHLGFFVLRFDWYAIWYAMARWLLSGLFGQFWTGRLPPMETQCPLLAEV